MIRNLTDDEAILVMADSNLQREKILPSEKAFAYKMKLEAMNRQTNFFHKSIRNLQNCNYMLLYICSL